MSMMVSLVTLADENIKRLLADPPLVWRVIAPDDITPYNEARGGTRLSILDALMFWKGKPQNAADIVLASGEGECVCIDKAWHGIHYLLTSTAWEGAPPLNLLVGGGQEIGDVDVGYGPARAFTAEKIAAAHLAISRVSPDELRGRFNPKDMLTKEIYPKIWARDPKEDDALGYLMGHFEVLKGFLKLASGRKMGAVVFLS